MNAKDEFLEHVFPRPVTSAIIAYNGNIIRLKWWYTVDEWADFLVALDFDYNNGYGHQEIEGTIWFADGSWSTRAEYDGSEWWYNHIRPEEE